MLATCSLYRASLVQAKLATANEPCMPARLTSPSRVTGGELPISPCLLLHDSSRCLSIKQRLLTYGRMLPFIFRCLLPARARVPDSECFTASTLASSPSLRPLNAG